MTYIPPGDRARIQQEHEDAIVQHAQAEDERHAVEMLASIHQLLAELEQAGYPNSVFIEKIEKLSLEQVAQWPKEQTYQFKVERKIPHDASKRQARKIAMQPPTTEFWGVTEVMRGWVCERTTRATLAPGDWRADTPVSDRRDHDIIIAANGFVTRSFPMEHVPPAGLPKYHEVSSFVYGSVLAYPWTAFQALTLDLFAGSNLHDPFSTSERGRTLVAIEHALRSALNRQPQRVRYYGYTALEAQFMHERLEQHHS